MFKNKKVLISVVAVILVVLVISSVAVIGQLYSPFISTEDNSDVNFDDYIDDPYGFAHFEFSYDDNSEYAKNKYLKPGDELKFYVESYANNGEKMDIDDKNIECAVEAVEGNLAEDTAYDYTNSVLKISENQEDLSVIKIVVSYTDSQDNLFTEERNFLISKEPITISLDYVEDYKTFYTGQEYDFTVSVKNKSGKNVPSDWSTEMSSVDNDQNPHMTSVGFSNDTSICTFSADDPGNYEIALSSEYQFGIKETVKVKIIDKNT